MRTFQQQVWIGIAVLTGSLVVHSYANRPEGCPTQEGRVGEVTYRYTYSQARGSCGIQVSVPQAGGGFRLFQFFDDSLLLSYLPQAGGHFFVTGAYLFPRPRLGQIHAEVQGDHLVIELPSQRRVMILGTDGQVVEYPVTSHYGTGQVQRILPDGILLDLGSRTPGPRGNDLPHVRQPNGLALFVDPNGTRCELSNQEVFDYGSETPRFRLTDSQLRSLLRVRCPSAFRADLIPSYSF